jgi:outer membrane lipoprotein LolB
VSRTARGLAAAALLLSACATPPVVELKEVEFDLAGRLAARYRNEAFTGNLNWRHAREGDELLISTPLGQGVARIVRQGKVVTLTTPDGEQSAPDAESLTEQTLGFRLPLAGLADWVRARPSPDTPAHTEYGADGRLARLQQSGWSIDYQAYDGGRPSRMRLTYPGIELRLAIAEWK